jgi:hypothetical protein
MSEITTISPTSQISGSSAQAAQPLPKQRASEQETKSAPQETAKFPNNLPYTSPILVNDTVTGALVQQWRDPGTGEDLYQIPSRSAQLYGLAQERTERAQPDRTAENDATSRIAASVIRPSDVQATINQTQKERADDDGQRKTGASEASKPVSMVA